MSSLLLPVDVVKVAAHRRFAAVALLVLIGAAWIALAGGLATRKERPDLVGARVPAVSVLRLDGTPVELRQRIHGAPVLLMIASISACTSCASYPLEFEIIRREFPLLTPLFVGSGASAEEFEPLVRQMGLDSVALIDPDNELLKGLGITDPPPLTLLADGNGRILMVDHRSVASTAQFPVARVLRGIATLTGTIPTRSTP